MEYQPLIQIPAFYLAIPYFFLLVFFSLNSAQAQLIKLRSIFIDNR